MVNWRNFVGKEFKGKRSGKYKVLDYTHYTGRTEEWNGYSALYVQSLSSKGRQKFYLIIDVLSLMSTNFDPSNNMDEAFANFCNKNSIPKLPGQHTIESYYISFYNCFLSDATE